MKAKVSDWVMGALVVGLVVGAIVMGFLDQEGGVASGEEAPDFAFVKWSGGEVTRADLKGKVVILDFWATWCPPCIEEMPWLVKVAQEYESKGVAFVAVNRDEPETAEAAVKKYLEYEEGRLAPYVVFSDSTASMKFRVRALPTMFILSRDGKILASQTGSVSERKVRRWLDEALKK